MIQFKTSLLYSPDGTTKLNAIMHCGVPSPLQKSVYTAILKGLIALVTTQFLPGSSLHRLEYLLEQPLLALALNYRPQRVHSIGEFLLVQEGKFGLAGLLKSTKYNRTG